MTKRKGIGSLLYKKEEDKVTTVCNIIDTALTDGTLDVGCFSVIGIQRQLKVMMENVTSFERDKFFMEFSKLYNLIMAPDFRAKGVFHPSQLLDQCPRACAYEIGGVEPSDRVSRIIPPELQRIFDVGTWYHLYIQNILYTAGVLEQSEVPVINKDWFLNGKADGIIKEEVYGHRTLLEIKSMNSMMFGRAAWKPFKKHEFQASLYAKNLGLDHILYLYINKDTSQMREFLMPTNLEAVSAGEDKMSDVIAHVKARTLPPRICTSKVDDAAIQCMYCSKCFM